MTQPQFRENHYEGFDPPGKNFQDDNNILGGGEGGIGNHENNTGSLIVYNLIHFALLTY